MAEKDILEVATHIEAATEVDGHAAPAAPGDRNALPVLAVPTQVRRPWRSTIRTTFQALVALATLVPFIAAGVYDGSADYPAVVGQVLAVAAAISRVMALPGVEKFLRTFLPWLAAAPKA